MYPCTTPCPRRQDHIVPWRLRYQTLTVYYSRSRSTTLCCCGCSHVSVIIILLCTLCNIFHSACWTHTLLPRHAIALEHAALCRQVPLSVLSHVLAHDSSGAILRSLGRSLGVRAQAQAVQHAWHIHDFYRLWARTGFPGGPSKEQYLIHVNAILLPWLLCPDR